MLISALVLGLIISVVISSMYYSMGMARTLYDADSSIRSRRICKVKDIKESRGREPEVIEEEKEQNIYLLLKGLGIEKITEILERGKEQEARLEKKRSELEKSQLETKLSELQEQMNGIQNKLKKFK